MKLHTFYKQFDKLPKDQRFQLVQTKPEPTSMFVIFQQLASVRAQKKFFEDREAHLLTQAEEGMKQIYGTTNL